MQLVTRVSRETGSSWAARRRTSRPARCGFAPAGGGCPPYSTLCRGTDKFICIGLNYTDHAAEAKITVPPAPIVFMKATSANCGPDDEIELPRGGVKLDWEVELAVVIGKPAKYVTESRSLDHIAGYCVVNDVSERAFQIEHHGQWTKGKSHDTFGPVGPWLVTADGIADPQSLSIWLTVNERPRWLMVCAI